MYIYKNLKAEIFLFLVCIVYDMLVVGSNMLVVGSNIKKINKLKKKFARKFSMEDGRDKTVANKNLISNKNNFSGCKLFLMWGAGSVS